ncbi:PPE family protein [Mycobacterium fragae]|uniref:PPE family protein n=1 Tax=Mycobacterium fragae TaxID=1260918 RepID=UPI00111C0E52|nr:PPE family protein [Mycobacterium fragae]
MDFGMLPPEINSGLMYSGPGAGPLLAASVAWDELAAELGLAASGYNSVISELTSAPWTGPASMSMAAAAAPYVSWLSATAAQAEQTASQARAAVAAYEAAFAMTVPPPVIAANRALLMALIATNFFGQNTPAIMATEAQYMEMWAQDAAAMYGYAAASQVASTVSPFTPPARTTNPAGVAGQAAAVAKAASTPAGTSAQTTASMTPQLVSTTTVPPALQEPAAASTSQSGSLLSILGLDSSSASIPSWLVGPNGLIATVFGNSSNIWNSVTNYAYFPLGTANSLLAWSAGMAPGAPAPSPALGGALPPPGAIGAWGNTVGPWGTSAPVSASVGQANAIGNLSVPSSWPAASSALNPTAPAQFVGTPANAATGPGALLRGMPMGGAGSRRSAGFVHRYGFRHAVMPRPPSAG